MMRQGKYKTEDEQQLSGMVQQPYLRNKYNLCVKHKSRRTGITKILIKKTRTSINCSLTITH